MGWSLLESRVDWLTATAKIGGKANVLFETGLQLIQARKEDGDDVRPWYWQGYRGSQTPGVSVGFRMDGAIVRLSGSRAGLHWRTIAALGGRATRFDLCVTAADEGKRGDIASKAYEDISSAVSREGRPTHYSLIRNTEGGETLYCGRRSSQRFGRLYRKDKEGHYPVPPFSWRWEVEYKGETAALVSDTLLGLSDEAGEARLMVANEFSRWGAPVPPLEDPPNGWIPVAGLVEPDAARRLSWLGEVVAPAVEKLAAFYTEEEILSALGVWYTPTKPIGNVTQAVKLHA